MNDEHIALIGRVNEVPAGEIRYCELCNSRTAVMERGLIPADVEVRFGYAEDCEDQPFEAVVRSCEMCIEEAPTGSWNELREPLKHLE